jgi:polyisoprenoid-binding protein YceI
MLKQAVVFAAALILILGVVSLGLSKTPASLAGSWQVDTRHSDAQLITDGTTDYGKTKITVTLGFGRVNGGLKFDDGDPTKSSVDLRIYPATAMMPDIGEDGNFKSHWLANTANHTLVCFHSKGTVRTADGKLQTTGNMILTRVDRNVDATPSEAYVGPVYGPPIIHRVSHQVTLIFDPPATDGDGQKDGVIQDSASTKVFREDFPQLLKAVTTTYWPPVVQDKTCQSVSVGDDYHGIPCTGTLLEAPAMPPAPHASNAEDIPGPSDFNAIVGERLNILVHMRLVPKGSGEQMMGGS